VHEAVHKSVKKRKNAVDKIVDKRKTMRARFGGNLKKRKKSGGRNFQNIRVCLILLEMDEGLPFQKTEKKGGEKDVRCRTGSETRLFSGPNGLD
jgi:hypothetical protein